MKKVIMLNLLFMVTSNVFAVPVITEASAKGTTFKFEIKLSEKLPTGYKVKINLLNGKGSTPMKCSGNICSLSSSILTTLIDDPYYEVDIFDAKGAGSRHYVNYVILSSKITSGYTKITNSGAKLLHYPDNEILGTGPYDWACTKDNKTGLTWELKTDDGGLRDRDWGYSWYNPTNNGGNAGYKDTLSFTEKKCLTQDNCNTYAFINAVNAIGLCGKKNWRLPDIHELNSLLTKTSTINKPLNDSLYIDANYFPNMDVAYWSGTTRSNHRVSNPEEDASVLNFTEPSPESSLMGTPKYNNHSVILVSYER
jgi:hypothetical protein